jgi:hypothetical protein
VTAAGTSFAGDGSTLQGDASVHWVHPCAACGLKKTFVLRFARDPNHRCSVHADEGCSTLLA